MFRKGGARTRRVEPSVDPPLGSKHKLAHGDYLHTGLDTQEQIPGHNKQG